MSRLWQHSSIDSKILDWEVDERMSTIVTMKVLRHVALFVFIALSGIPKRMRFAVLELSQYSDCLEDKPPQSDFRTKNHYIHRAIIFTSQLDS